MHNSNTEGLELALSLTPENKPLRHLLAESYCEHHRWEEAEKQYLHLIKDREDLKAKKGLARVYYNMSNYSASIIVLEEILSGDNKDVPSLILISKALLKERNHKEAIAYYQSALDINPEAADSELDEHLRIAATDNLEDIETELDDRFIERPDIEFSDVGGMDSVKKEIELKIIKPLEHVELYKAYGKKVGGGILLYGPPGCGKTFIAKATAGQVKAKFISIGLNDILDMWVGSSEKNLHEVFELARNHSPCVVFIDEIDALGASRSDMKQSNGRHLINQFLQELDGISGENDGLLILGATNTPWNVDSAFRRPGRFDRIIFVPPPDLASRSEILRLKLINKPIGSIDYVSIAKLIPEYSGADIDALIDIAIETKLQASFESGIPQPLTNIDLKNAAKKHNATTKEWFATAKNFATFANDSGLYDDVLNYMKKRK